MASLPVTAGTPVSDTGHTASRAPGQCVLCYLQASLGARAPSLQSQDLAFQHPAILGMFPLLDHRLTCPKDLFCCSVHNKHCHTSKLFHSQVLSGMCECPICRPNRGRLDACPMLLYIARHWSDSSLQHSF